MPLYVALFRGINVGGHNKLLMRDLAPLFTELGCTDVSTYIQSGNVLFRATPALAKRLPAAIAHLIAERFAIKTSLTLRSADQLRDVIADNPYPLVAVAATLHVLFLTNHPSPQAVAALTPIPGSQEEFIVRGEHIYLHLPNGSARAKLPNFDKALATIGTARNWRTVLQLHKLVTAL